MINFHGYGPRLLVGAALTTELAVASLALSVVLGLILANAKISHSRILRTAGVAYTAFVRGVPPLVMMMLVFYGGQVLVNDLCEKLGTLLGFNFFIRLNPFLSGIITLGFIYAAYMSETFRGAYLAVDAGQIEAAHAFGMTEWLAFRRIRFPLMMRHALPGISNNWMVLLKATALVSIIGLHGMVRVADQATKDTHDPFLFMIPVAGVYLLLTSISEVCIAWLQRRFEIGFEAHN